MADVDDDLFASQISKRVVDRLCGGLNSILIDLLFHLFHCERAIARNELKDFSEDLRLRATSLAMALDREVDRHRFAVALLRNLDRSYDDAFAR